MLQTVMSRFLPLQLLIIESKRSEKLIMYYGLMILNLRIWEQQPIYGKSTGSINLDSWL